MYIKAKSSSSCPPYSGFLSYWHLSDRSYCRLLTSLKRSRKVMKVRELLKKLEADGWYEARMKGSHRVLKHPQKSGIVVVPGNFSDELAIALQISGKKHKWSQNNERIYGGF